MRISEWERANGVSLHIDISRIGLEPEEWRCRIAGPLDPMPGRPAVFLDEGRTGDVRGYAADATTAFAAALRGLAGRRANIVPRGGTERNIVFPGGLTP